MRTRRVPCDGKAWFVTYDAMSFWTLDWILDRTKAAPTPVVLKVAIVIQGLFIVGQVSPHGVITDQSQVLLLVGVTLAMLAVLVPLWKMKRWPVIVLIVYAVWHAARAMPWYFARTDKSLPVALVYALIILAFHNIALIAALPYWRRLTWT
jgi:hypothetical protein